MVETKFYCDHCGKELDEMHDYTEIILEIHHKKVDADLCCDCFEELHSMAKDFCGKTKS